MNRDLSCYPFTAYRAVGVCAVVLWMLFPAIARADEGQDLLEHLMASNRQSHDAIKSVSYEARMLLSGPDAAGHEDDVMELRVIRQGDSEYGEVRRPIVSDRDGKQDWVVRYVVNPGDCGFWIVGSALAYSWDSERNGGIPKKLLDLRSAYKTPVDPLLYAFGDTGSLFEKARKTGKARWTAKASEDGTFQVNRSWDALSVTYRIDPNKGFLVTRITSVWPNGTLFMDTEIAVDRFGKDRHWFPVRIEQTRYAKSSSPNTKPATSLRSSFEFRKVVLNREFDKRTFEFAALGTPEGQEVIHKPASGDSVTRRAHQGVAVPIEISDTFAGTAQQIATANQTRSPHTRRAGYANVVTIAGLGILVASIAWKLRKRIFPQH